MLLITRVGEPIQRAKLLLDGPRACEPPQNVRATRLVVRAARPSTAKRLLADQGRRGLAVCPNRLVRAHFHSIQLDLLM